MSAMNGDYTVGFYVVGGTMRHDAPSYVERRTDAELLNALANGEFCYVLTARQMGKSSLMIRTAARLRDAGIGVAVLDVTSIGQNLTADQWYGGLLVQIGQRLDLEDELIDFWPSGKFRGPMQRWIDAIRVVVLPRYSNNFVIFIDEIDAVRSLPFSTDEFFAGIRQCYNRRSEDSELRRLTFCLSGVATPSNLIRDTRTTPFNIGRRIELHDFTESEAAPLVRGLGCEEEKGAAILKRILHWTSGHPYLTQRLCQAVAEDKSIQNNDAVDRLCENLFFSLRAQERDDNLLFVRERLLHSEVDLSGLLGLYRKVRLDRAVFDDETNPLVSVLRLSGVARADAGRLKVRNRIYARVFNKAWIDVNMPDAEIRRQRAAFRKGVWRTGLLSVLMLSLVGWLAFVAIKQRNRAEIEAAVNRRLLNYTQVKLGSQDQQNTSAEKVEDLLTATVYHTQIKLAFQEWDDSNIDRVEELLDASEPQPGIKDWRGFEWYWLQRQARGELFRLKEDHQIANVILLADGKTLALCDVLRARANGIDEYLIKLVELNSGKHLSSFRVPAGKNFSPVVFSPDQRQVAVDGPDKSVTLWEVSTGKQSVCLKGHQEPITAIAFAPDGRRVATGDFAGVVKLWDAVSGRESVTLKRHGGLIRWVTFSPDGRLVATTDGSLAVRLWNSGTGSELQPIKLDGTALLRAWFFPSGKRILVAAKDGHLHICAVHTRRRVAELTGHAGDTTSMSFSPDGSRMATGNSDRTVKLWDTKTGQELMTIRGHGSEVRSVAWSADGRWLVSGSADSAIKVWDVAARGEPTLPTEPVTTYLATRFSTDGELIAFGVTRSSQVKLWNLSTGMQLAEFDEPGDHLLCATFSRDGRLLATGGMDRTVRLWDVRTGKNLRTLTGHTASVYGIDFSPDGQLLISGGEDRALKLWDVATGRELVSLHGEVDNSFRAVFSPDGRQLASACRDGSVNLWDLASGAVINRFVGHTERVRAIVFSPDGRQLVTGGQDNTVRLWSVVTGQELKKLGQSDYVQRAVFSRDGKRLVTGSADGSVKLWDVITQQELMTLRGHAGEVTSVSFSSDGFSLATSGSDGTVRLWRATPTNETRMRF